MKRHLYTFALLLMSPAVYTQICVTGAALEVTGRSYGGPVYGPFLPIPNPSHGAFSIRMPHHQGDGELITGDMLGRVDFNTPIVTPAGGMLDVHLTECKAGIYHALVIWPGKRYSARLSVH
jgi:hypothetical protein